MQLAGGDERALTEIIRHYSNHLYQFVFSVTKSASVAEEVIQDVFVAVWKQRAQLCEVERFEDWLFIVTRNHAYKALRRELRRPGYTGYLEAFFALSGESPEEQLLLKESRELITHAATTLPPQQQRVFRMSRLQGRTLDEIASQLQLSKNTVKVHLTKALQGIRLYLRQHA